jgi:hypothetical protein
MTRLLGRSVYCLLIVILSLGVPSVAAAQTVPAGNVEAQPKPTSCALMVIQGRTTGMVGTSMSLKTPILAEQEFVRGP